MNSIDMLNQMRTKCEQEHTDLVIRASQLAFIECLIERLAKTLVRCKNESR